MARIIDPELGKIDLELILINSLTLNVSKVQEVTDTFLINKTYISIFCFTQTKVDSTDFIPTGIKLFTAHRTRKDKNGGELAIGHLIDDRIKLEEIEKENRFILILEGTIHNEIIRIILTYIFFCKETKGLSYKAKREIQKEIEKFRIVDPGVKLVCLGDMNGRLKALEP